MYSFPATIPRLWPQHAGAAVVLLIACSIPAVANVAVAPTGTLIRKETKPCSDCETKTPLPTSSFSRPLHRHQEGHVLLEKLTNETNLPCPAVNGVVVGLEDLEKQKCNIFPSGNTNSAAFRWAAFLLGRATMSGPLTHRQFHDLNKGFCPISGAMIAGRNTARLRLQNAVNDDFTTGRFHYCGTPCICDAKDMFLVDNKTVNLLDGKFLFQVLVLGDPCKKEDMMDESFVDKDTGKSITLKEAAPEIVCSANLTLKGAVMSDNGFPIFGLFYTERTNVSGDPDGAKNEDGTLIYDQFPTDPTQDGETDAWRQSCAERARAGYKTGKGDVFRKVAQVAPIRSALGPDMSPDDVPTVAEDIAARQAVADAEPPHT